jgi:hypothetical protein
MDLAGAQPVDVADGAKLNDTQRLLPHRHDRGAHCDGPCGDVVGVVGVEIEGTASALDVQRAKNARHVEGKICIVQPIRPGPFVNIQFARSGIDSHSVILGPRIEGHHEVTLWVLRRLNDFIASRGLSPLDGE